MTFRWILSAFFFSASCLAADFPAPQENTWTVRDFKFHTGEVLPEWMNGNYAKQPRSAQFASIFYGIGTNGGNHALFNAAPNRQKADELLDARMKAPFPADANDVLYQWDSSRDYNPSPGLERIRAKLLAINSADDERNPPELGVLDREIRRVKNGRVLLIPASDKTIGHGTTSRAQFWKKDLEELLRQ